MKLILPLVFLLFFSGKASDTYNRTQKKIKNVQNKIDEVNQKIEDITLQIDSSGFIKATNNKFNF